MKIQRLIKPFKLLSIYRSVQAIAFLAMASFSYGSSSFQGLGVREGSLDNWATSVSNDGHVFAGFYYLGEYLWQATYWTDEGDSVLLSNLPDTVEGNAALSLSGDGQTIIGISDTNGYFQAVRWQNGVIESLGLLEEIDATYGSYSQALEISNDGSAIVGYGSVPDHVSEAFYWTQSGGMVKMGFLSELDYESIARGVSADGSIIVGNTNASQYGEAFRWTQEEGMQGIGHLPSGKFSRANAVSDDGSVIVGSSSSKDGSQAFRWEDGEMVGLGFLDDTSWYRISSATATSGDGSLVVGYTFNEGRSEIELLKPFIWDKVNGMQPMHSFLTGHGLDLEGWILAGVGDMTPDGLTFVGSGINPDGKPEAWIAHIPEPTTLLLLSIGSLLMPRRRSSPDLSARSFIH